MDRIYWFLLKLLPGSFRQPFAGVDGDADAVDEEMYGVFLAASSEARESGLIQYIAFCGREIGGLLGESFSHRTLLSRKLLLLPLGAAAGALLALVINGFLGYPMYTSTAVLFESPESVIRPYLSPIKDTPVEALLPNVLSNNVLTNIIYQYNLYPSERARMPIGGVLVLVRKNLSVNPGDEQGVLKIRFRYFNPFTAQKVAQEIVSRIMSARLRDIEASSSVQIEFLEKQVKAAAEEWDRLYAQSHAASAPMDAARARYESLQIKLADAKLGSPSAAPHHRLEMVDPANVPSTPDISYWKLYAVCIATGAIAGMLYPVFQGRRRRVAIPSGDLA